MVWYLTSSSSGGRRGRAKSIKVGAFGISGLYSVCTEKEEALAGPQTFLVGEWG